MVFGPDLGVTSITMDGPTTYVLGVADVDTAAPGVARALMAADADILSLTESHHSLEDVYLQFVEAPGGDRAG